jgi:uncharacterized membrane protein
MALSVILWIIGVMCAIWVIYDVFTNQKKMDTTNKVLWTIFAIIFSIITGIIYYFVIKRK